MKAPKDHPVVSFIVAVVWWCVAVGVFSLFFWATLPFERKTTAKVVNAAFAAAGDQRRVSQTAPLWGKDGVAALAGTRFLLQSKDETAVVFSVAGAGFTSSFVAVYSSKKGMQAVLPLDDDSKTAAARLPAGLLDVYLARIASAESAAQRRSGK
jgi:hypothetical protein